MGAPESIYCNATNNKSKTSKRSNTTKASQQFNETSTTQKTTTIIETTTSSSKLRHPNFTFDFPLCLVHVGKAAGSSVSCSLGLMYANCEGMPRQPGLANTYYFHMRKNTCPEHVQTLLVTIRNPLTRIRSWFDFEKNILPVRRNPKDQKHLRWKRGLIFDCYDNFVDLVLEGLSNSSGNIDKERPVHMTCPERAWAAVLGVREFSYHEWYNYEYYWTAVQNMYLDKSVSLLVLRTEHLLVDWSKLSKEDLYKQVNKGNSSSLADSSNSSSSSQEGDDESKLQTFWSNLCRAMCPEIKFYQQLLHRADNLDASQVRASVQEVQALCPTYDPKSETCPGIPEFPKLKIPRRAYAGETKKRLFAIG